MCAGKFRVAGQQRSTQCLSKCDVSTFINSQRFTQLPDSWHERVMSVTLNDQPREVVERLFGSQGRDFLALRQATQRLRDFNVDQMRSMEPLRSFQGALHQSLCPNSSQQYLE